MTSGKQAKRARRAQAPAPVRSKAARAPRKASPKVLIAAAVVLVVIGGVVAAVLAFTGGSSSSSSASVPRRGSLANALPGAADVHRLFNGIPQHGNVLGSPKAPVTMVEYIDLQCPICRAFETEVMPTIVPRYVRTGKVRVEARPIAFIGPDSARGRSAALAAARQNRLFDFAQILYDNQGTENTGWLDDSIVTSAAASIPGLDVPALLSERNSSGVAAQERQLDADASTDGVTGTPAIYVGKTGAAHVAVSPGAAPNVATLEAALDRALR
jgi:protein-disulfide isomerase